MSQGYMYEEGAGGKRRLGLLGADQPFSMAL